MNKFKLSKGFTLIEVMLAVAIFAIAGTALLRASSNNLTSISYLEQKMFANWVAANRLTEVNLEKKWPPKNNLKGSVEMGGREWFWWQKVQKTEDAAMRVVTVEVRLNEADENLITSVLTFVSQRTDK